MIFRQLYVLTSCSFSPKFHNDWIKIVNFIYVVFPNSAWTKFGNSCLNLSVRFISRPSFKIRTYSESSQNCRSIAVLYDSEALIQLWIIYIIVVSRNSRHTVYVKKSAWKNYWVPFFMDGQWQCFTLWVVKLSKMCFTKLMSKCARLLCMNELVLLLLLWVKKQVRSVV